MPLGLNQAEAAEIMRAHDAITEFNGYCDACDTDVQFTDHEGRKNGEAYEYCICQHCGAIDSLA